MRGEFSVFRQRLLKWFEEAQRTLPWREQPTLYKTVVSEFMLQQTQVDTVIPYFQRWLNSFPGFEQLAEASEDQVMKHWEGLGYYSRARNLHKLAKSIIQQGVPRSAEEWRKRPGIGPYTAAAIGSIAQGLPVPVIDGNVIRVLSRLENDSTPVKSSAEAHKRLLPLAEQLMDADRPGDFNEGIMELGATICKKVRPSCLLCPVSDHCQAAALGSQDSLPVILRKTTTRRSVDRLWLVQDDKLLLHIYPKDATRLAGMAELPELAKAPAHAPVLTRSRGISTERIRESIFELDAGHPLAMACIADSNSRWIALQDIQHHSLSGPHKKWVTQLLAQ
jgi:A/G-specific adenine glycosylase